MNPVGDDGVTIRCASCGAGFARSGRRRFCSPACRQTAWRRRQAVSPPLAVPPASRAATVYVCGDCEQRYLGEQWCPDCNRPCRKVGAGGLCPHCDEPVAVADLVTGALR